MEEILNKEALECAIDKLREMVNKFMPDVDPDIVVKFYRGTDGRPWKYVEIGKELSSNRRVAQRLIGIFRDRASINGAESEDFTLSLFEAYRRFYWKVFGEAQRRQKRREE